MNKLNLILFAPLLLFTSCFSLEKTIKESYRSEMYIDYKYISYQGSNEHQKIYFQIDSTNGLKYWGQLIINEVDTTLIIGYEKGGFYPTWYVNNESKKVMIDIWCRTKAAQIPEEVEISQNDTLNGIVKQTTILKRQPRNKCY